MKLSRREALGLAAGAGLIAATGCRPLTKLASGPPEVLTPPQPEDAVNAAFLARFGFGHRPGDLEDLRKLGRAAWMREQLAAPNDDPWELQARMRGLAIHQMPAYDLRAFPANEVMRQMQTAAILRAVYSPWQLRERLVDFFSNHLSIYARKGLSAYRKPTDEKEVVRAHVLGKFPDMLMASAKSTAMLLYLDQQASSRVQPNENYARELLELHSLGVHGGYTQKDVMEAARCFTGWTEERGFLRDRGSFVFRQDLHDDREKTVLGHKIPAGGGVKDGEKVVQIVAHHPATALHLASKLGLFFLGVDDPGVRKRIAAAYKRSGGGIPEMMQVIFEAAEDGITKPGLKRPFDFIAGSLRALDADTNGKEGVLDHLLAMGQPLHQWPMPDGYPVDAAAWSGSLLGRWNFAHDLVNQRVKGAALDLNELDRRLSGRPIAEAIFGFSPTNLLKRLPKAATETLAVLSLASPEYQWR